MGEVVTPEQLSVRGLAKGRFDQVKILGDGDLTKSLSVTAHRFSASAEEKILAAVDRQLSWYSAVFRRRSSSEIL